MASQRHVQAFMACLQLYFLWGASYVSGSYTVESSTLSSVLTVFYKVSLQFTRIQINNENLTSDPWQQRLVERTQMWPGSNSCGLTRSWNKWDKRKQLRKEQDPGRTVSVKTMKRNHKNKSGPPGILPTINHWPAAHLWIILRQLWEVLKWWKPVYHVWHYLQTSVLSLSASWGSTGIRQTHRGLSSNMAQQHHLRSSAQPQKGRGMNQTQGRALFVCVCV